MNFVFRHGLIISLLFCLTLAAAGQERKTIEVPKAKLPPPPDRSIVAATVNGQPIHEIAIYRALAQFPVDAHKTARPKVLEFLAEKVMLDQYLNQLKIKVDPKDVDKQVTEIKEQLTKNKKDFNEFLKSLFLTEQELRTEITGALRWEAFVNQHASDDKLKALFAKNKEMFDGSLVRARHILIKPETDTPEAAKKAQAYTQSIKKYIEGKIAQELAKLPDSTGKLEKEQARVKALDKVFSETAEKYSSCPSKKQGGELGWFPRLGKMVEPFSAAAFALQPFTMSDPVASEFGYHLILTVDEKKGREVTFDQVKPFVRDVYSERLREAVLVQMKKASKVEVKK